MDNSQGNLLIATDKSSKTKKATSSVSNAETDGPSSADFRTSKDLQLPTNNYTGSQGRLGFAKIFTHICTSTTKLIVPSISPEVWGGASQCVLHSRQRDIQKRNHLSS